MSTPADAPYKQLQREPVPTRSYTIDRRKLVEVLTSARKNVLLLGAEGALARATIRKLRPLATRDELSAAQVRFLDLPDESLQRRPTKKERARAKRLARRNARRAVVGMTMRLLESAAAEMVVDSGAAR